MNLRSFWDLPDEYLQRYIETYEELCLTTPRVGLTLALGIGGQIVAALLPFEVGTSRPLLWLAMGVMFPPFVIYMLLVFVRLPPPIPPCAYRRRLLGVVNWYRINTVIATLATLVALPAGSATWGAVSVAWALILVGFTATFTIMKIHNVFLSQELELMHAEHAKRGA
jgi:hypothetical protein